MNSNKSSPIPGRANPSPRSSEIGNAMRRSFNANPFSKPSIVPNPRGMNPNTPANSPAENPRRSSVSKDFDDKENPKAVKLRSPMSGSKAAKNFMSPTISAASKINPSPRKRILEERNVSFSDQKMPSFGESVSESNPKKEGEEEEALGDTKTEPALNSIAETEPVSSLLSPSTIPPLDSDPSARPYDPKTNFLSPRPQFLHYKPNPRVELFLSNGKEGKRLEDSFISESFSDADASEEETIQADDSPKESEDDVSSIEEVKAEEKEREEDEEEVEEEDELVISEPNPVSGLSLPEKETVGAKIPAKSRSVWRSNVLALLIVTSIVCVSISIANLQVIDHSVFDGSSNFFKESDNPEMLAYGKATLDGVAQKLGIWYENYVSLLSDWLSSHLKEAQGVESLQYYNLTELFEDGYDLNVFVLPSRGLEIDISDEFEEKNPGLEIETFFDVEEEAPVSEQKAELDQPEIEETKPVQETPVSEQNAKLGQPETEETKPGQETPVSEQKAELYQPEIEETKQGQETPVSEQKAELDQPEIEETKPVQETPVSELAESESGHFCNLEEMSETREAEVESASVLQAKEVHLQTESSQAEPSSVGSEAELEKNTEALPTEASKASEEVNFAGDETYLAKLKIAGMALLVVLAAIGSASLVAAKKGQNRQIPNEKSSAVAKKLDYSPEKNNPEAKEYSSWSFSGDYCPSEMSSYENEARARSYGRSQKKNGQRRESMASSSMDTSTGSPSYGSFTTYEKIPTKNGYGDDEIITPVRRSSRLRTQVTSPS